MKTKTSILLAIVAIATVSFTVTRISKSSENEIKETTNTQPQRAYDEPAGGFVTEDKF